MPVGFSIRWLLVVFLFCFGCSDLSLNLFLFYTFLHSIAVFKSKLIHSAHFFRVRSEKERTEPNKRAERESQREREEERKKIITFIRTGFSGPMLNPTTF